jgi:hypothetical protein
MDPWVKKNRINKENITMWCCGGHSTMHAVQRRGKLKLLLYRLINASRREKQRELT